MRIKLNRLALIFMVILFVTISSPLVANASYKTGFDSFTPLSSSPGPFSWYSSNPQSLVGMVQQDPYAYSLPNDYQIEMYPSGSGTNMTGILTLNLNASSTTININWFQLLESVSGTIPSGTTFSLIVNGKSYYTVKVADMNQTDWTEIGGSVFAIVGAEYTVQFEVNTQSSTSAYQFVIALDNIYIKGANVFLSGSNLFLTDLTSGTWFDIDNYSGSTVAITYSSGQVTTYQNIYSPDMYVNLNNASLITVNVGNIYYRTVIAQQFANNNIYLDNPSNVEAYSISVTDISGYYPAGSAVYIYYGNTLVTSGYLDAASEYNTYLVPNVYTIKIVSPQGYIFQQTIRLVKGQSSVPIYIYSVNSKLNNPTGYNPTVSYTAGWNTTSTGIVVAYRDTSDETSSINVQLLQTNQTFSGTVYSTTVTGPLGFVQVVIPADSQYVNINNTAQLTVTITAYSESGSSTIYGPILLNAYGQYKLPTQFYFPNILGIQVLFPNSMAMTYIIAIIILLAVSMLFGAMSAPFGIIIEIVIASFFAYIGALPLNPDILISILLISVLGYIGWRERNSP